MLFSNESDGPTRRLYGRPPFYLSHPLHLRRSLRQGGESNEQRITAPRIVVSFGRGGAPAFPRLLGCSYSFELLCCRSGHWD